MEDIQVHLTAHKAAVEGIKSEAEEKRLADLDSQSKKHQENIGINLITNSMKCVFIFILLVHILMINAYVILTLFQFHSTCI